MIGSITGKRIVVAPLCWGLGHASRCIPIINRLIKQQNTVSIASDGEALTLLKRELPELDHFELPAYNIQYKYGSMILNMATQGLKILSAIKKEKNKAEEIAESWNAEIIISDNRLGFRSSKTKNIYLTHQLNIPHPNALLSSIANKLHHRYINKYDKCWIPDQEGENSLSGKMSQAQLKIEKYFIGIQSRLKSLDLTEDIDISIILSGPEPQRTRLEQKLIEKVKGLTQKKIVIVRGTEAVSTQSQSKHITFHNLLTTPELNRIICRSKTIICRSGYSSLMDLVTLGKGAILIPTPGQYEQEYLAEELDGKFGFRMVGQKELSFLKYIV